MRKMGMTGNKDQNMQGRRRGGRKKQREKGTRRATATSSFRATVTFLNAEVQNKLSDMQIT